MAIGIVACLQTHGSCANWHPHQQLRATDGGFRADGTFVSWPTHDTARLTDPRHHRGARRRAESPIDAGTGDAGRGTIGAVTPDRPARALTAPRAPGSGVGDAWRARLSHQGIASVRTRPVPPQGHGTGRSARRADAPKPAPPPARRSSRRRAPRVYSTDPD